MKIILSGLFGALVAAGCAGCTGPFGMVLGGAEIQSIYNQRVSRSDERYRLKRVTPENENEPVERYSLRDRQELNKIISR